MNRVPNMSKILIAEDDGPTRVLVEAILEDAGYTTETVTDGKKAYDRIATTPFDLLLTDIWMPGLNGLELLSEIKTLPSPPPVIVMTSDDTSDTLLKAIREQAYHYISKPIDPQELTRLVQDGLSAGHQETFIEVTSATPNWVELLVPCDQKSAGRMRNFVMQLEAGLPEDLRETIAMSFYELLANAIEWGGQLDPSKKVRIAFLRFERMLMFRIADPGSGFDMDELEHAALNNPDDPIAHMSIRENRGLRPGGFGLLMVKTSADELIYNEARNEVAFVKYLDLPKDTNR